MSLTEAEDSPAGFLLSRSVTELQRVGTRNCREVFDPSPVPTADDRTQGLGKHLRLYLERFCISSAI